MHVGSSHLKVEPDWIQYGTCTYDDGEKTWQVYAKKREITCAICASDLTAIGMLNAITETGLKVPDDINLVSFDGTDIVDMVRPRITSISQSFYRNGTSWYQVLTDGRTIQKQYLPFKIVEQNRPAI